MGSQGLEQALRGIGDQMGERLGPWTIRDGEIFVRPSEQDDGSIFIGDLGTLGGQGGLAHTRFPADEHQMKTAFGDHFLERIAEHGSLAVRPRNPP